MTFLRRIDLNPGAQVLLVLLFLLAAGCAPRPGPEALSLAPHDEAATRQVTITVATTRARDAITGNYTDVRASALNFEAFTISIPPTHKVTQIEWPTSTPDAQTSFAVIDRTILPDLALMSDAHGSGSGALSAGKRDILIFVHGYNYTFAESLFRLAQIAVDGNLKEMPILFAWPSDASVTGYLADRDAVIYSRDDLVHVLKVASADPAIGSITLSGHSMGGYLVAEALRQLRLSGQNKVVDRLENVVLAAPDIDIDVFRRQVQTIGALNPPITLLVSPDDRALKLSERLAGLRGRVGTRDASDPQVQALAAANGIRVIDISNVDALDGSNHNRFAALMTLMPRGTKATFASLAHAGSFILEPVSATLVASRSP